MNQYCGIDTTDIEWEKNAANPAVTNPQIARRIKRGDERAIVGHRVRRLVTVGKVHEQIRRIRAACAHAKIEPAVSFHALLHSYASLLIKGGVPLPHVAKALGHGSIRMVEIHYGHLAPSDVADAVRANLPNFGAEKSNVTRLRR